jgi:hypothetical protein
MTYARAILDFYFSLPSDLAPPNGVEIIHTYEHRETRRVMEAFYTKYYNDTRPRTLLLGINPGRHGAGLTGVGFTDPILMEEICAISNDLPKTHELSAQFICEVVQAYGGAERFYGDFLFSTVLPFGLLKEGKNYNYYDDKETLTFFEPLILQSLRKQLRYPNLRSVTASIGSGKNLAYLEKLNERYGFFERIEVLPHPRWVMQYRRKRKEEFVERYVATLRTLVY